MVWRFRYRATGVVLLMALLCTGAGFYFFKSKTPPLPDNPLVGSALALDQLVGITKELQESFNRTKKAGDTASDYIDLMEQMEQACQPIYSYKQSDRQQTLSADDKARIAQVNALCQDLNKLATTSKYIYISVSQLLRADTTPRRYELLAPLAKRTRQQHAAAIESSIAKWSQHKPSDDDFPTALLPELKQLQVSMRNSQGLEYMPALHSFQSRLLGERQQYWLAYADLSSLTRSLTVQLTGFCQSLNNSDKSSIKRCQ